MYSSYCSSILNNHSFCNMFSYANIISDAVSSCILVDVKKIVHRIVLFYFIISSPSEGVNKLFLVSRYQLKYTKTNKYIISNLFILKISSKN